MLLHAVITWRWSWNDGPAVIRSDATGYYAYLRALFINGDLGHEKFDHTYLHATPTGTLNKYFAGEALMLTPFFLGAHGVAHAVGVETDGLTWPYLRAIGLAALTYAALGLWCFRRLLLRMDVPDRTTAGMLLLVGLGTQLIQYTTLQPGWSHAYSFGAIGALLLCLHKLTDGPRVGVVIACGALYGLVILIRPVNALVLFALPILHGSRTPDVVRSVLGRPAALGLALLTCIAVVGIQCVLWYAQVGQLVADGYKGEGFYWKHPKIYDVLFSVRRGLFVWAPVLLIAALAIIPLWLKDRWRGTAVVLYWGVNTYVIACWWIWYYGSGWGQRVYVDHYPALFLPLALVLPGLSKRWRKAWTIALTGATVFTLLQFYQYNHRLMDVECMDRWKYQYAFMRFDDEHRDRFGGMFRVPPFAPNGLDTLFHERWGEDGPSPHWSVPNKVILDRSIAEDMVTVLPAEAYGPTFQAQAHELPDDRAHYLIIHFLRKADDPDATRKVLCVVSIEGRNGNADFYQTFTMEPRPIRPGEWEYIEYRIPTPVVRAGESLKFYLWNQNGTAPFAVKDLDVALLAVKPY